MPSGGFLNELPIVKIRHCDKLYNYNLILTFVTILTDTPDLVVEFTQTERGRHPQIFPSVVIRGAGGFSGWGDRIGGNVPREVMSPVGKDVGNAVGNGEAPGRTLGFAGGTVVERVGNAVLLVTTGDIVGKAENIGSDVIGWTVVPVGV